MANFNQGSDQNHMIFFLFLNINIHYASMQSEIDSSSKTDSLKQCISELKIENDKIRTENVELKAKVAKLEDKQTQNELIKNLLSISYDKNVSDHWLCD